MTANFGRSRLGWIAPWPRMIWTSCERPVVDTVLSDPVDLLQAITKRTVPVAPVRRIVLGKSHASSAGDRASNGNDRTGPSIRSSVVQATIDTKGPTWATGEPAYPIRHGRANQSGDQRGSMEHTLRAPRNHFNSESDQALMRYLFPILGLLLNPIQVLAQAPPFAWARFAGNQGAQQASGRAIATDHEGHIYVVGIGAPSITWGSFNLTNNQHYMVKLDPGGTVLWARSLPMRADHLATDKHGNVFVSSSAQGSILLDNINIPGDLNTPSVLLVKFDPNGTVLWYKNHTPSSGQSAPGKVFTDASGNVYLCGAFNTSLTLVDHTYVGDPMNGSVVFAVSYTADGTYRRSNATTAFPPTASLNAVPAATCDTTLAIYRGGAFGGVTQVQVGDHTLQVTSEQDPAFNAYIIKWNPDGAVAWAKASGGIGTENISDLMVDRVGRVVVSGGFSGHFFDPDSATVFGRRLFLQSQSYNLMDMFVGVFNPDGETQWVERAGGNHVDGGARLTVDQMNNVYAFGNGQSGYMSFGPLVISPYSGSYLAKYTRNGTVVWVKPMTAGQGDMNTCYGASVDHLGNIYVAGMQSDTIRLDEFENITPAYNNFDVFVARLNNCSSTTMEISSSGPLELCAGDSVDLSVPVQLDHWWSTMAVDSFITVTQTGQYSVIAADDAGCFVWSDTLEIAVFEATEPTVSLENGVLSSSIANTYQWLHDGDSLPGATLPTHDPEVQGFYSVITSDEHGCYATSEAVFFSTVGIHDRPPLESEIRILGNGRVSLQSPGTVNKLRILNGVGQVVFEFQRPDTDMLEIELPAPGVYLVQRHSADQTSTQRFIAAP